MATSSISSGVLSASAQVFTGKNRINALTVLTDGTNPATIEIYDNTDASGKKAVVGNCVGANLTNHYIFENPVLIETGIYVNITGAGATCIVFFGG